MTSALGDKRVPVARVLLVEDDPALLEVLSVCLEDDDHEVRTADGFSGGAELLQRERFDLVLTDLCAREYSAKALRAVEAFARTAPTTPVVLATAHADAATLEPAQYGLAAVILKPFDLDDLLARVRDVIAERQQPLKAPQATSSDAWDHFLLAQEHIGRSKELLDRVHLPKAPVDQG